MLDMRQLSAQMQNPQQGKKGQQSPPIDIQQFLSQVQNKPQLMPQREFQQAPSLLGNRPMPGMGQGQFNQMAAQGAGMQQPQINPQLMQMYQQHFGRQGDPAGMGQWQNAYSQAGPQQTQEQMAQMAKMLAQRNQQMQLQQRMQGSPQQAPMLPQAFSGMNRGA